MKSFFICLIAFLSFSVNAGLISDSNFVIDTDQKLDWLHWEETNNRSYNDVLTELSQGGDFDGWRYATATEAETFLANFGLTNYSATTQTTTYSIWDELVGYMGEYATSSQAWIYGMVESSGTKARTYSHYNYDYKNSPEFKIFNLNKSTGYNFLGSFLVRDTSYQEPPSNRLVSLPASLPVQVSEPSTIMLMLLTVIGLVSTRRFVNR